MNAELANEPRRLVPGLVLLEPRLRRMHTLADVDRRLAIASQASSPNADRAVEFYDIQVIERLIAWTRMVPMPVSALGH
jgi:hypothetical protein